MEYMHSGQEIDPEAAVRYWFHLQEKYAPPAHQYDPNAPRIYGLIATKTVLPNGGRLYINKEGIPVVYVRWAKRGLRQLIWDGILIVVAKTFRLK